MQQTSYDKSYDKTMITMSIITIYKNLQTVAIYSSNDHMIGQPEKSYEVQARGGIMVSGYGSGYEWQWL
jgi:hypothetical protein